MRCNFCRRTAACLLHTRTHTPQWCWRYAIWRCYEDGWNDAGRGCVVDAVSVGRWPMAKTPTTTRVKSVVARRALRWSAVNSVHPSAVAVAVAISRHVSRHRPLSWRRLNIWNETATTRPTWTRLLDRVMSPSHPSPTFSISRASAAEIILILMADLCLSSRRILTNRTKDGYRDGFELQYSSVFILLLMMHDKQCSWRW